MYTILVVLVVLIALFVGFVLGVYATRLEVSKSSSSEGTITTQHLGEAALTLLLTSVFEDRFPNLPDLNYDRYDGSKLPLLSGYNTANACLTYIKHGGSKSRAIERFLDNHLRSREQVSDFLKTAESKLKNRNADEPHPPDVEEKDHVPTGI